MKTYMLVHGAWHGAWSYDETKARLERDGARVITFDLPGHGSDTTDISAVTMQGYVDAVKRQLAAAAGPVTLVGHSLSGFVVSQAAEEMPERVEQLIFIAAMVPHDGKSIFDEINEDSQSELLQNLIFADDKSWATVSADTLKKVVYNGASPEQIAAAAPRLVRQATQPFFAKVTTSERAFGAIEKAYIVCEKDRIFSPEAQRRVARIIGAGVSSLPTGHVPHVENPAALAAAIASVQTRSNTITRRHRMTTAYLLITLKIADRDREAAAGVYAKYKQPFLNTIDGARSKELLIRDEDVAVLHGFDSSKSAEAYLRSPLFARDVVTGLSPYLAESPKLQIYTVA